VLDKGAEIIRQAKEERKNTKMDKTRIIVVEDNIVYCEFVCNLLARTFDAFTDPEACIASLSATCWHGKDSVPCRLTTSRPRRNFCNKPQTGTSWFLTYDYPTVTASTYYDGCARKA